VIGSLARVRRNIIKLSFNYVLKIMKHEIHGTLKGCFGIFKAERHLPVCKITPSTNKCHLVLILGFNLNLIISLKSVHKIKYFTFCTLVEILNNERCGEVVFRTGLVQVTEILLYIDGSLFLIYKNEVGYPFG
jgi:hypothetical protein